MPPAHTLPALHLPDLLGPAAAAMLVVLLMTRIREPVRQKIHVVIVAGLSTLYVGGALGPWELLYVVPAAWVACRAMDSYWYVAMGWLLHPAWDIVHHLLGSPVWPWMPASSIGCAVFDSIIAIWAFTVAARQKHALAPEPQSPAAGSTA